MVPGVGRSKWTDGCWVTGLELFPNEDSFGWEEGDRSGSRACGTVEKSSLCGGACWWDCPSLPSHSGFFGSKLIAKSWETCQSKGTVKGCPPRLPCRPPVSCTQPTSKFGGIRAPKPKAGNRLSLERRKGCGLPVQASLPDPTLTTLPVIVLADASHCAQGLQVVVGLSGAEAVQGLAAPWVPIGGCEVDSHLREGRDGTCCSHKNQQAG